MFLEKHGVKLGFMSAFVKAAASALIEVPAVNAVIDGNEIVYRWGSVMLLCYVMLHVVLYVMLFCVV